MNSPGDQRAEDLREAIGQVAQGLRAFSAVQKRYDEVGWHISNPSSAKVRHIVLHLGKSVGQLAGICEAQEHVEHNQQTATGEEIRDELAGHGPQIAHLLISAVQLAEIAGIDLGALIPETYIVNAKRFAPESEFAKLGNQDGGV